nr:hypothetical protein [Tanacetum cinerariifolium]
MEAIEKRFGGNTETKKVQKILLKQKFNNFTGSSSEDLVNLKFMGQSTYPQLDNEDLKQPVEAPILDHTPKLISLKTNGSRKRKNRKTCFVCRGVDHLIKDYTFYVKPKTQPTPRNYVHKGYDKQHASSTKKYPQKHRVHVVVFTKSKPISVTTARPVSAANPKIMAAKPRHAHSLHTKNNLITRRHQTPSKFSKNSNSSPKVTAAHAKVVSTAKGKKGKWVWRLKHQIPDHDSSASKLLKQLNQKDALERSKSDKGVIDSRCSRHMTGNMSYLSDFQELNGGYVAFGGNPKGGKIIGKGKIKIDSLLPIPFWVEAVNTSCYVQNRNKEGDTTFDGMENHFEVFFEDNSNDVSAASPIVPAAGQNCSNRTNPISAAGPSKADFNNLESSITVSLILTIRIHNAHLISQIIGFMVYQIDVKSAFLYGTIEDKVYVCQPPGFKDPDHPDKVYKVVKALYGLHQAPRACATNKDLCKSFEKLMKDKFQMCSMGELTFFLGKLASTPIDMEKPLLKDPDGDDVDVHIYRSMISSLMYLTSSRPDIILISWQCKKQTVIATSSTEAEYVAGASCYAQVLWIENQMLDYGLKLNAVALNC